MCVCVCVLLPSGIYDKQIAEAGAIPALIAMLQFDDAETRGFAAACLLCLCKDSGAHGAILESGGADLLTTLSYHPTTWLRGQVLEMLTLLGIPIPDPENPPPQVIQAREQSPPGTARSPHETSKAGSTGSPMGTARTPRKPPYVNPNLPPLPPHTARGSPMWSARMKFHFFSFQINGTTGANWN